MKLVWVLALVSLTCSVNAKEERVYLLSKRQVVDSNHTLTVLFYDKGITNLSGCQREIQRGIRGQWRYYTHSFPRQRGYSEKLNYYCIESDIKFDPWFKKADYDLMYQFDLRQKIPKIKKMQNYETCLRDLRRFVKAEKPTFFCAKVSQEIR